MTEQALKKGCEQEQVWVAVQDGNCLKTAAWRKQECWAFLPAHLLQVSKHWSSRSTGCISSYCCFLFEQAKTYDSWEAATSRLILQKEREESPQLKPFQIKTKPKYTGILVHNVRVCMKPIVDDCKLVNEPITTTSFSADLALPCQNFRDYIKSKIFRSSKR